MKRTVRVVRVQTRWTGHTANFRNWFAGTPWGGMYHQDFRERKGGKK